ncbi:DUF4870 domain-containing protein [Niallia sp. NCCP-28]|uniref:DUF4870 domain-containing protein n=1 Tax=Niallia sp. NCCP-28 TaxID=2934712 RepID=UPI00208143EA|nr:DUF4870 domain-containing protein [Niallia sp. NCCP-28]GKU80855.1 DUF4870 domain-containing protein [Niallia sp. NCCP-28]
MEIKNEDKLFALAIYASSFFTIFLGPLIIWLIKRDSEFVNYHGKEYFNFLISYTIYFVISGILTLIFIGFILGAIVSLLMFIFTIIACIKAYEGKEYRIPMVIRIIR